jgi:signal peptidase I
MTKQFHKRWCAIGFGAMALYGIGNLFQPVVVMGSSMEPTLRTGQLVWADRFYYRDRRPARGDVVVFRYNGATCIKRIYRAPGETIYYRGSVVDGLMPVREAVTPKMKLVAGDGELKRVPIPDTHVFVVGDNFARSEDSRAFGAVPIKSIIGRVHVETDARKTLECEISPRLPKKRAWYRTAWDRLVGQRTARRVTGSTQN